MCLFFLADRVFDRNLCLIPLLAMACMHVVTAQPASVEYRGLGWQEVVAPQQPHQLHMGILLHHCTSRALPPHFVTTCLQHSLITLLPYVQSTPHHVITIHLEHCFLTLFPYGYSTPFSLCRCMSRAFPPHFVTICLALFCPHVSRALPHHIITIHQEHSFLTLSGYLQSTPFSPCHHKSGTLPLTSSLYVQSTPCSLPHCTSRPLPPHFVTLRLEHSHITVSCLLHL